MIEIDPVLLRLRLKSARPLLAVRTGADPLLGFSTLCTGSFAVGSRLPGTTAFIAIRLHTHTIGPHAFANGFLCRAWDSSQNQSRENGRAMNNSHQLPPGKDLPSTYSETLRCWQWRPPTSGMGQQQTSNAYISGYRTRALVINVNVRKWLSEEF